MLMEKLQAFAEGKYDVSVSLAQISEDYENKRTDASQRIEDMNITKRIVSTSKMMQTHRQNSMMSGASGASSLARSNTASTAASGASGFAKKFPPPPPSFGGAAAAAPPPPYTPSGDGDVKKAPPPPPPLKPKPKASPPAQYVVALYDFTPQVRTETTFWIEG